MGGYHLIAEEASRLAKLLPPCVVVEAVSARLEPIRGGSGKPGAPPRRLRRDRWALAFLSSANLTEQAFSINMELGVLITGGERPRPSRSPLREDGRVGYLGEGVDAVEANP